MVTTIYTGVYDDTDDTLTDTDWLPMDEAPQDGTEILGWYGPDEIVRIRWAEERRCMLASVAPGAGLFGPGWECVAESLIVEDPLKWQPDPDDVPFPPLAGSVRESTRFNPSRNSR